MRARGENRRSWLKVKGEHEHGCLVPIMECVVSRTLVPEHLVDVICSRSVESTELPQKKNEKEKAAFNAVIQ